MKKVLLLLGLSFFLSSISLGQKSIKFLESQWVILETYDSTEQWSEYELTVLVSKPDSTISQPIYIELGLTHVTTDSSDVRIKSGLAKVDKLSFNAADRVELKFLIEIKGDTLDELDELFFVEILSDTFYFNEFDKRAVTIENGKSVNEEMSLLEKTIDSFEMSDTVDIGYFILNKSVHKIPVFRIGEDGVMSTVPLTVNLTELNIHTNEGRIENILLICEGIDGYFECDRPISLTNLEDNYHAPLRYVGPETKFANTCVTLKDLLVYRRDTDKRYFPPNAKYRLTKEIPVVSVRLVMSVLDYFDARAYSDFLGLNGQENGLLQTEVNFRFIGNTQTHYFRKAARFSRITCFQYINLNLSYSKFDSQFDTLDVRGITAITDTIKGNLLPIIRHSNLSFNVETDVFRYSRVHDVYLTFGHRINVSTVLDTSGTHRIINPFFYVQPGGTLRANPVLQCSFSIPFLFNYIHDQPFNNFDHKWMIVIQPTIELMYRPLKENKESGLSGYFFRIKYYDMPWKKSNNFFQLQFGTSLTLSDLADKNK